jgi:predicted Fe-S protein YdhL (DUF1289 family)
MTGPGHLSGFTAEDFACAGLHRVADGFEDWSIFTAAERHESLIAAVAQEAALQRRGRRQEEARQIRVIKAMQKAGLPVSRAVVSGVDLEFSQAGPAATLTPLEAWKAKHARHA